MRQIKEIILHCTATQEGREVHVADVDRWHKQQGWECIGYHYLITLDGKIEKGRPEWKSGAHCKGHNNISIGIAYVGGVDYQGKPKDTRTDAQKRALVQLLRELKGRYPKATIHGHNEFATKACPSFNVQKWLTEVYIA
ncbi:peptidoglycan recognition protein family protein [Porphyromonas endodontalis]|nr:MAG TPA: endodeoxyribonuclease I [Caudoviricetes sp.]